MKTIITLILLASFSVASANIVNGLYLFDLTKVVSDTYEINMYDDEISGDFEDFGLILDGKFSQDFITLTEPTNPEGICEVEIVKTSAKQTIIRVIQDIEIDSGDYCNITVKYKNGKKFTAALYSTGT